MTHRIARLLLIIAMIFSTGAQAVQKAPSPGDSPTPTPTPLPVPATIDKAAPDAPVPELSTLPTEREKPKTVPQKIGRKLKDAVPSCLDGILHTCWSQPSSPDARVAKTPGDAAYVKDMEVGDFNLKSKNYRGAAFRYEHALTLKARDPEATFKLALAQERMGNKDDARCNYREFLQLAPNGPFSSDARKALERLRSGGQAGPGCPQPSEAPSRP